VTYSNVDDVVIYGLNDQAARDGSTRDHGADAHHTGRNEAGVVVFVDATNFPNCN
jgi:hypothetical protein